MRTDVQTFRQFYDSPLGAVAARFLNARLEQAWGDGARQRICGFGYIQPFLENFSAAERLIALAPEGMGAIHVAGRSITCLTADHFWPLPDASMDRVLVIHGLEEAAAPRRLMREIWRVLTDDGSVVIAVPNRRGPWSMVETTPFSCGRPYLRGQLARLLKDSLFTPLYWSGTLNFPPFDQRFLLRAANAWEQAGDMMWPAFSGVILVEAAKELSLPVSGSRAEVLKPRLLSPAPNGLSPEGARAGQAGKVPPPPASLPTRESSAAFPAPAGPRAGQNS